MDNETWFEITEKDGLLIHQGVINVPYTWAAGKVASKFYTGLKDKQILGLHCTKCDIVFVPPKKVCHHCFSELTNWVPVSNIGTLQTYTVIHYSEPDIHPFNKPFAYGIIKLDGASTSMVHIIADTDLENLTEGMRLQAVFKEKPEGNYLDIKYFTPVAEANHG